MQVLCKRWKVKWSLSAVLTNCAHNQGYFPNIFRQLVSGKHVQAAEKRITVKNKKTHESESKNEMSYLQNVSQQLVSREHIWGAE